MKVFITQYALTQGILEKEVNISHTKTMVSAVGSALEYYHKPHWHETREEAVAHAKLIREKKLKSLQKQIDKIKTIKF